MNKFIQIAVLTVLFLTGIVGPASAGIETRITNDAIIPNNPAIDGDRIVWEDERNGNNDIYMYDLFTKTETQITTDISHQYLAAIDGNRIVWRDDRNGTPDIYMYDLSTHTETQITTNVESQNWPNIDGNRIVWEDSRNRIGNTNHNPDIYMYDLSTNTEKQITTNTAYQDFPIIDGNRIVWQDLRNGIANWDIYMYDLSTNTETQITTNTAQQSDPDIDGNRIVWVDRRNGNEDIYMYDLSTNTETQVTNNPAIQIQPAIDGNRIVWGDYRNGIATDVYMYDLSTNTETQVTNNSASQGTPAIDGNRIVWVDERNGEPDIYMYDLSSGPIAFNVLTIPNPVSIGTDINLTASVSDETTGGSNIISAEYSVDDGSFVTMKALDGIFDEVSEDVTANISSFNETGIYSICVRGIDVTDIGETKCILLAVFDPTTDYIVTGGGWINSPEGAYKQNAELKGRANFGFVSKYQKGTIVPIGQTEFQFQIADLKFHSSSYDWLVVAGAKAIYKGKGTINGVGNYGFMLSAIDSERGEDKFRIKIWDNADTVVYDNMMNTLETADPTTLLGGGNIIVHKN